MNWPVTLLAGFRAVPDALASLTLEPSLILTTLGRTKTRRIEDNLASPGLDSLRRHVVAFLAARPAKVGVADRNREVDDFRLSIGEGMVDVVAFRPQAAQSSVMMVKYIEWT